jgi:hypothetical protein
MQNYTDDDLIKGCINGNAHIEYALYKTYASKLFAVALRYTHIEADAEDVLQNAFVDIYKNIGKFKYQGRLKGGCVKLLHVLLSTALKTGCILLMKTNWNPLSILIATMLFRN